VNNHFNSQTLFTIQALIPISFLAYRFIGDAEMLAKEFIECVSVPAVITWSIDSFSRLDKIKGFSPWAFTIGTAFFEKKFTPDKTLGEQILRVIEYMGSV
jgi:hypothetical protein